MNYSTPMPNQDPPSKKEIAMVGLSVLLNFYCFGFLAKFTYALPLSILKLTPHSLMMNGIWAVSLVTAIIIQTRPKQTLTPGELMMGARRDHTDVKWHSHFKSGGWVWVVLAVLNLLIIDMVWGPLERGQSLPLAWVLVGGGLGGIMIGTLCAIGQGRFNAFFGLIAMIGLHYTAKTMLMAHHGLLIKELELVKTGAWMILNCIGCLGLIYCRNPDRFWNWFQFKR